MEPDISVDPTPVVPPPSIDVDPHVSGTAPLDPATIDNRAQRYHYGIEGNRLGPVTNKTFDDIRSDIADGREAPLRDEVSAEVKAQRRSNMLDAISNASHLKGGPLTSEEIYKTIETMKFNEAYDDPKSVFESEHSKKYVETLYGVAAQNEDDSWFSQALRDIPKEAHQVVNVGKEITFKTQFAYTQLEDAEAIAKSQGYGSWSVDKAKSLLSLGFYEEAKLRGQVPGTGFFGSGVLLGSNLEEQGKVLFRLSPEQFKSQFESIMTQLKKDNPSLAVEFARYMVGMSQSDVNLQNFMSLVTVGTGPGVGTIAKVGLTKLGLLEATKKATTDVIKSSVPKSFSKDIYGMGIFPGENISIPPPMAIAHAAAGDLGTAATTRTSASIVRDLKGTANPAQEAMEALPRILDLQADRIASDPGKGGQELVNRLKEAYTTTKANLIKTITERLNIERIPEVTAVREGVDALKEIIKKEYPGPSNRIIGIGDPIHEPATNTWHSELALGRQDATYFASRDEAEAVADVLGIKIARDTATLREMANKTFGTRSAEINYKITKLRELKNREVEVTRLQKQLQDLQTWHAEKLTEFSADVVIPGQKGFTIENQGLGFYISRSVPVPEKSQDVRNLFGTTTGSKNPEGYLGSFTSWLRTAEDTASADGRMNAKVAIYGGSILMEMAKEEAASIRSLARWTFPFTSRRQRWNQFDETLRFGQTARHPVIGDLGYTFETPGELQTHYLTHYNRDPIDAEYDAYFSFKRWMELDAVHRELNIYRNKHVAGAESHSVIAIDSKGMKIKSSSFDGMLLKDLPNTEDGVLVMGSRLGKEKATSWDRMNPKSRTKMLEEIKQGRLRVVEVYDPDTHPFKDFGKIAGDSRIRYVVTDKLETGPLSFEQLPRRGGGHFEYDYDMYLKQANIKFDPASLKQWYKGDTTVMPFQNGALARRMAEHMNEVRELIKKDDWVGAAVAAKKLPIPVAEHLGWYKETHAPGGVKVAARLDKNEPFHIVPRNKMIMDLDKTALENRYLNNLRDATRQGSAARLGRVAFTEQRDSHDILQTIVDEGSRYNPLYKYQPAELVSPVPSMNRALTRIANSAYMDDYKTFAVERWMQRARDHLEAPLGEISHSPLWFFNNEPKWKGATPIDVKSRLLADRMKIQQLLGTPSVLDTVLHSIASKMADSIYEGTGLGRLVPRKLDPSWMIPKMTDMGRALRSAIFDVTIGMFSPAQFVVQSMTYVTIAGIEGMGRAGPGAMAAMFHQWTRLNPKLVDKLDELASKFHMPGMSRWRPGEFKEANELLRRTGFAIVGGEHIFTDRMFKPQVITSGGQQFLDAGRIFFKEGERNARFGAWYTAYRKYRDLNPTGRITNNDLAKIFDNADLLAGNMSTASKSLIQRGPLAFTTQFLAYNMRLMELMVGKRLSLGQKARLFTTYAAVFGAPSAISLYGYTYPLGDSFRAAMIENGYYVPGENAFATSVMEGVGSGFLTMITGNRYNVGQRYASPGVDTVRDVIHGDKAWWTMLGGAAWSKISGAFEAGNGFYQMAMSTIRDDNKAFQFVKDDLVEPLREISAFNAGWRLMAALNSGKWLSKKGILLDKDVSGANSIFMTVTGLQNQEIADLHLLSMDLKSRLEMEKWGLNKFIDQFNRGFQDMDNSNPEQANAHFKRGIAYLKITGYPQEKYSSAFALASKGNETLISRINWNYYMKDVPPEMQQQYMDTYRRKTKAGLIN